MLKKLMKAAIWTVLLNGVVRGALRTVLMKSLNWILQPSMRSAINAFVTNLLKAKPGISQRDHYLQTLLKAAFAFVLLRFTKKSWIIESVGISTIGALLLALMRLREGYKTTSKNGQKDQIIDIDEYTIVDEKP